jgi:hypothetical protein
LTQEERAMIKRIFSQKKRTVKAALKNLGLVPPPSAPEATAHEYLQCRVNSLRPDSVVAIIGVLARAGKSEEEGRD